MSYKISKTFKQHRVLRKGYLEVEGALNIEMLNLGPIGIPRDMFVYFRNAKELVEVGEKLRVGNAKLCHVS